MKDEMAFREPTDKEAEFINSLVPSGGFKRGQMLILAGGSSAGQSTLMKLLKERDTSVAEFTLSFDAETASTVVLEDVDTWRPTYHGQSENRVQRRRLLNAITMRKGKSRREREGYYTFKQKGRHTRSGPNAPRIIQFSVGDKFDQALIRAKRAKEVTGESN